MTHLQHAKNRQDVLEADLMQGKNMGKLCAGYFYAFIGMKVRRSRRLLSFIH